MRSIEAAVKDTNTSSREAGFLALYDKEVTPLIRLAFVILGSNELAEEVVQDAFLEVYRRWDTLLNPGAYARRAVVNRATSVLRRRRLERRLAVHARHEDLPWWDGDTLAINAALRQLSPRQRAAVHLRYVEGFSEEQIALNLGCRPGTVKSLLARSRSIIRKAVGDEK